MSSTDMMLVLQFVCMAILIMEYVPQIKKILKTHSVEDLSLGYWLFKILFTVFNIISITLGQVKPMAVISQCLSILLASFVVLLIIKYHKK